MNVQPGSRYVRTVGPCHAHPGRRRQRSLGLYLIHDGLYLIHEMRHFRVQRQADRPDPTRPDQTRPTESRQTDRPTYTHAYTWTHTLTALAFLCVYIYILLYIHIMYTHTHTSASWDLPEVHPQFINFVSVGSRQRLTAEELLERKLFLWHLGHVVLGFRLEDVWCRVGC